MQQIFPVVIEPKVIGGVQVDVVTPKSGVASRNSERLLINLHGGGFMFGARYGGQQESIPIASLGQVKVVTIDYRMAPEHRFPAASEDVAKVYSELLKTFKRESIGIYGVSAGAALTAQSVAWFQMRGLPTPGAICLDGGGAVWSLGDSDYLAGAFGWGIPPYPWIGDNRPTGYFEGADRRSPLLSPASHPDVLAKFPPTLIMNATRDQSLSGAVYTHSKLVSLGVEAELHVWEGMHHAFTHDHTLPESRQAYDVLIRFFDKHLAR